MQIIELTEAEFDKLMNRLDKVEMEKDGYIPSEEDVFDYILKNIICICCGTANISRSRSQKKKKRT